MSAYDSAKDVFFVRTWRCAGEAIGRKMKADSTTSNTINHSMDYIKSFSNTALAFLTLEKSKNWDEARQANVSILTSVEDLVGTKWENYWKFAVVRNPYSLVYSEWKYINRQYKKITAVYDTSRIYRQPRPAELSDEKLVEVCKDFNKFVAAKYGPENESYMGFNGIARFGLAGSLYHANGSLGVDEVLYFEDLNNEWNTKVATPKEFTQNVSIKVNHIGVDEITGSFANTEWSSAYNTESINLVANAYCADLELFGYSFSDGSNKPTGHTIPTKADPTPPGPWQGRSQPGKRFSAAGGHDYGDNNDSVTVFFKNRVDMLTKEHNWSNSSYVAS